MLISIYSDSTAIPRRALISIAETWPEILASMYRTKFGKEFFFINRSFGGIQFKELLKLFKRDSKYYFNDRNANDLNSQSICVFTSGIVDGAPRPITYKLKLLSKIPFVGPKLWGSIVGYLSKFRPKIQSHFAYTTVPINEFRIDLQDLAQISLNLNIFVILLETPMPHSNLELRSPGIIQSIKTFNTTKKIIASSYEHIRYVELADSFNEELYLSAEDGHHFNVAGHTLIADILYLEILDILDILKRTENKYH